MNERVLIIEDDEIILRFLKVALKTNQYEVIDATNGVGGINMAMNLNPQLILLDLGLPDMDGLDVLREIRSFAKVPIIIVSARDKEREKIEALDLGADDYLTKPFNVGELMARIRVVLRRGTMLSSTPQQFEIGDLKIDFERRKVLLFENEIHFTPIEFKLIKLLVDNRGKVMTHSLIHKNVWGYDTLDDYQSLRVYMASLRRKIETDTNHPRYLLTEVGVGYRFVDE